MHTDSPDTRDRVPYAVLGAGIAGLSAALALLQAGVPGRDILIVEAQDKPGGRVRSQVLRDGTVAENGAAWFHPDDQGGNPFMRFLTDRYSRDFVHIVPENPQPCLVITKEGLESVPFFDENIDNRLRDEFNKFRQANPGRDISLLGLARRIKDKDRGRAMIHIRRLAENYMGSAHEYKSSASEVFTDPYGDGGPQVWEGLECGLRAMAAELRERGVVFKFGTRVTGLAEDGRGVSLTDDKGGVLECGNLICTLPVPILKSLLPDTRGIVTHGLHHYLNGIQTSHFTKIIVPMDGDFLRRRFAQDAAIINTASDRFTEAGILPAGKPMVVLFATGETALRWEKLGQEGVRQAACEILDRLPGLEGYRDFLREEEIYATDWNVNPLFRGSYGAMKVGNMRQGPMRSQGGRIIFAGTEFHPVAGGSMATAHESGLIAARMMLDSGGGAQPGRDPAAPCPA